MAFLIGMFHALVAVLATSGAVKVLRPEASATAIRTALPFSSESLSSRAASRLARSLGLVEIVVAGQALLVPQLTSSAAINAASADLVALLFGAFILFVARLRAVDPQASCGCFGSSSAPPGLAHQRFNLGAAIVAGATATTVAFSSALPRIELVTDQGVDVMLPYLAAVAIAATVFVQGPALLSDLASAMRGDHNHGDHHGTVKTFSVADGWRL